MDPYPVRFPGVMTTIPSVAMLVEPITEADHIRGNPNAPVTLVEYGEFECPHCGRAYHAVKQLLEQNPLDVRFVFRHFARDDVHPFSERSALAAESAGSEGLFWEMHDFLFERQHQLEYEDLIRHADQLSLDVGRFQQDLMGTPALLSKVRGDLDSGIASGVISTPTFFIDGIRLTGSPDIAGLTSAVGRQT